MTPLAPPGDAPPQRTLLAGASSPLLRAFNQAGVLAAADVHVADRLGRLCGESDERVLLAVALAVCAVRSGSVCTTLEDAPLLSESTRTEATGSQEDGLATELPWPEPDGWRAAVTGSPLVSVGVTGPDDRPVRWVDGRIYLDRFWRDEQVVRHEVDARLAAPAAPVPAPDRLEALVAELFPRPEDEEQRRAAATAVRSRITVLTGGPGTGKTTTVARIVAAVHAAALWSAEDGAPAGAGTGPTPPTAVTGLRVALAAPTGKAAARLQEAVNAEVEYLPPAHAAAVGRLRASTLHRLLGRRPGSTTRFRHDADQRLPHDLVVVDESSMVSLPLMAGLLRALRPQARLVLVGDPDQLASVEAGAVLGDLVSRPAVRGPVPDNGVVRLTRVHRYGGGLAALAEAIRRADEDAVVDLLTQGSDDVRFVGLPDEADLADLPELQAEVTAVGAELTGAALAADAAGALRALARHRLLLAHRRGPFGVGHWSGVVAGWVALATGTDLGLSWPPGLPVIVTQNDPATGLANGDTGVVIRDPDGSDGVLVAFGEPGGPRLVRPHRLPDVQPVHAMTVHRAQGSQFRHVSVLLPPSRSPLLTRELLYTAVTRAREQVRVIGSEDAVRLAVRRPVRRASGLREPW